MIKRRTTLGGAVATGGLSLVGCGGAGEGAEAKAAELESLAAEAPAQATATEVYAPTGTVPVTPGGRYRSSQPYLFQSIASATIASRIASGNDYSMERWGPTGQYVDFRTKWPWTRTGGDWIDADGVRHGTKAWASVSATLAKGDNAVATYRLVVTNLLKKVQAENRWCAILLTAAPAVRPIAALQQKVHAVPAIEVRYANGTTAVLKCRIIANAGNGGGAPNTTGTRLPLPAFLEFERPTGAVAQATLRFVVVAHYMNVVNPVLRVFLLDPPLNNQPLRRGVADTARALDEGLEQNPAIIGVQRYVDGIPWSEYIDGKSGVNTGAEAWFDPAIFGSGDTDLSKLPHRSLGKWVGASKSWSKVESTYNKEGFKPLAPGLGALRMTMPKKEGIHDGDMVGYSGTLAGNAYIYMPEPLFGRLGRIFVRHYFRLGTPDGAPYVRRQSERYQVYNSANALGWTEFGGKFALMPDHKTSFGGNSGSAGGGKGWTMRMAWSDCDAQQGGPDEGGIGYGMHLYDFQHNNPPGHNYANRLSGVGQIGGLGGILYAHNWYCLETELKLNSVDKPAVLADGTPHVINGVRQYWSPDGELRHWLDGRLVYEQTGMVFRSLPLFNYTGDFNPLLMMRPCRELGVRGLWLNWFHGGVTQNAVDRVTFVTGMAWGHQYIGPMRI